MIICFFFQSFLHSRSCSSFFHQGYVAIFVKVLVERCLWKMQRWIRPVMWNRRWSVGIILDRDGSKILCTGWLFRFQQAGGPQESTCEEESDFQAKSCESLYQWIIRVFTTCFWFLSFWRCLFLLVWNFGSWYPGNLGTGGPCFGLVEANAKNWDWFVKETF